MLIDLHVTCSDQTGPDLFFFKSHSRNKPYQFDGFFISRKKFAKRLGGAATWFLLHLLAFDQQSTALNFWSDWRMLWPAKTLTYASVNAMLEYLKWHVTTRTVILHYFTLISVKTSLHVTTWRLPGAIWCFRRAVWASRYTVEHALSGNRLISSFGIFWICSRLWKTLALFVAKKNF